MPPSGYSALQTHSIKEFLWSCLQALRSEATAEGRSAQDALFKEISDIDRALGDPSYSAAAKAVLELTQAYYEAVFAMRPEGLEELLSFGSDALQDVEREIRAIHIEPELTDHGSIKRPLDPGNLGHGRM